MRLATPAGLATTLLALAACGSGQSLPSAPDGASAALVGSLGPGQPPDGGPPDRVELVFSGSGGAVRTTAARDGEYEIVLPAGTWDVRAADGKACAVGLVVHGGGSHRVDLVYPSAECMSVGPPDGPAPAPPPPVPR